MGTDVSFITQLLLVDTGDSSGGVEMCVHFGLLQFMLGLLTPYIVQDFAQHLEQTQQMEFKAPTNVRHLMTVSQAAIQR